MLHRQAARARSGAKDAEIVTNVVIDQHTFERQLTNLTGADIEPDDPSRESYRCSTLDGVQLEPTEAVAAGPTPRTEAPDVGATTASRNAASRSLAIPAAPSRSPARTDPSLSERV